MTTSSALQIVGVSNSASAASSSAVGRFIVASRLRLLRGFLYQTFTSVRLACPSDGIRDVLLAEIERGELRSHGVRPLDAYRSQDDLTVLGLHVEVFRRPDGIGHALGKRELVFGSDFGEHRFLTFRK